MRKVREVVAAGAVRIRQKREASRSDERLRRLFNQAERVTDPRKKAQLKEEFIKEFYQGAG
jgi:hypothetical protein